MSPQDPQFSSTTEWERSAAIARRAGGQYAAGLLSLKLTSHTQPFHNPFQPFRIKWEVYFSKVCSFVIIVLTIMACWLGFGSVTTYNEKKLHLTQNKQGTSNN